MSYLTHSEFLKKVEASGSKYWQEGKNYRWQYIEYVIEQAKQIGGDAIIEAGASGIPLNDLSYLMDYPEHDLNVLPFKILGIPMGDKTADIFIALQTWEHLDNQAAAFSEVMRISKSAILSFPYKWKWGDARHKGIDGKKIEQWTCGVVPESIKIINHRAVYVWKF